MKFDASLVALTLLGSAAANVAQPPDSSPNSVEARDLFKRKGGGGGGGRGGGGGGGSRGGSGSSSSSSSSSNRGSTASSTGSSVGGANGGRSFAGSGPQPGFGARGGGNYRNGPYYGGGAKEPYRAGRTGGSPAAGIAAGGLIGLTALAFWPGTWYGPVYPYYLYGSSSRRDDDDDDLYRFFNTTANETQSKPVLCGCQEDFPCSCDLPEDEDDRDELLDDIIGNGSYDALDKDLVDVADRDGRSTILINGTLPDDTTLQDESLDSAAAGMQATLEALGYWPAAAAALAAVFVA